jgi:hypothetical protein
MGQMTFATVMHLVEHYRAAPESDRPALIAAAFAAQPELPHELIAWAAEAEGVLPGDFWLFCDAADLVADEAVKGALLLASAELRWMEGDPAQYVATGAIDAVRWNPDLPRAYEVVYEILASYSDILWEDALAACVEAALPADAVALLRHMIMRGEARGETPPFLSLAPREGASLAEADALAAEGKLAEAIAARRGATSEDFATARRAVVAS